MAKLTANIVIEVKMGIQLTNIAYCDGCSFWSKQGGGWWCDAFGKPISMEHESTRPIRLMKCRAAEVKF